MSFSILFVPVIVDRPEENNFLIELQVDNFHYFISKADNIKPYLTVLA
jgi:hypothetical protein